MINYTVNESDRFLKDVEEITVWILLTNIEQSEFFAEKKVDEWYAEIMVLKARLQVFPDAGEIDKVEGIHKFPLYNGRYSAKWIVDYRAKSVHLITISDSKYPKYLREIYLEADFDGD
jgi:predicted Rossmann fold nucleotide-binding protein DprA/Smf involved in DNA uptake